MKQLFIELKQIIDEMNTAATAMGFFPITLAGKEQPSAKAKVNKNALKEKRVNIKEENTMEKIIKTLLLEGIDEDTIHRVLDVIEEEYEVVGEGNNLERVVDRVDRLQGGAIPLEKYIELKDRAGRIQSPHDFYTDENGHLRYTYGKSDISRKGEAKNIIQKKDAKNDPQRIERKISIGKVVNPTSEDPEYVGDQVLRKARVQRKLQQKRRK